MITLNSEKWHIYNWTHLLYTKIFSLLSTNACHKWHNVLWGPQPTIYVYIQNTAWYTKWLIQNRLPKEWISFLQVWSFITNLQNRAKSSACFSQRTVDKPFKTTVWGYQEAITVASLFFFSFILKAFIHTVYPLQLVLSPPGWDIWIYRSELLPELQMWPEAPSETGRGTAWPLQALENLLNATGRQFQTHPWSQASPSTMSSEPTDNEGPPI